MLALPLGRLHSAHDPGFYPALKVRAVAAAPRKVRVAQIHEVTHLLFAALLAPDIEPVPLPWYSGDAQRRGVALALRGSGQAGHWPLVSRNAKARWLALAER